MVKALWSALSLLIIGHQRGAVRPFKPPSIAAVPPAPGDLIAVRDKKIYYFLVTWLLLLPMLSFAIYKDYFGVVNVLKGQQMLGGSRTLVLPRPPPK